MQARNDRAGTDPAARRTTSSSTTTGRERSATR